MTVAEAVDLEYEPQTTQHSWHACPAYESGFGGAKFGGKTLAIIMEALRYTYHPQYRGIIFRRTYPNLEEVIDRCRRWYPGLGGKEHDGGKTWSFPSGARILLRHCQNAEDWRAYQGHEYQFMGFDQLEEFSESQYDLLLAQNRSGVPELSPYSRSTFNPGGIGHGWVKARFIDRGSTHCDPWWAVNDAGTPTHLRCFHFSSIDDNPIGDAADPSYRRRLESLPLAERRALLHGDWDVFAGQFFAEWRRPKHVCEPFAIPHHWTERRLALDWGHGAPFSCHLYVRDEDLWRSERIMRWYAYRELYGAGYRDDEQAQMVAEMVGDQELVSKLADPTIWNKQPNGQTIAGTYADFGVSLSKANNDRVPGWQAVRRLLADQADGMPGLVYFSTCKDAIRTIPVLIHDANKPEDVDTDGEDHAADELRYFAMGLGNAMLQLLMSGPVEVSHGEQPHPIGDYSRAYRRERPTNAQRRADMYERMLAGELDT